MPYKVLIPDAVNARALDVLKQAGDALDVTAPGQMSREDLLAALPETEALVIRSASKIDAEALAAAPNLRLIARLFQHIKRPCIHGIRNKDFVGHHCSSSVMSDE